MSRKVGTLPPLLINRAALAGMLGRGERTIFRMLAEGLLPAPSQTRNRAHWWSRIEVEAWVAQGCPPREKWDRIKHKYLK